MSKDRAELVALVDVLNACAGNRTEAARRLGVTTSLVHYRVSRAKRAGLAVPRAKRGRPSAWKQTERPIAEAVAALDKQPPAADPPAAAWPATPAWDERSRRTLWRQYVAGGRSDVKLRNYLVELELPRVRALAQRTKFRLPAHVEVDDLLQAASMGLLETAVNYDPDHPGAASFWTFSARRVGGAMLDKIREDDHVPRVTRRRERLRIHFARGFEREHGRAPDRDEILAGLGWTPKTLDDSYPLGLGSIDAPRLETDEGYVRTALDVLASCEEGPDAATISESTFREASRGLQFDQQIMLWLYFVRGATMKTIGAAYGLCESRVSQSMAGSVRHLAKRWQRAAEGRVGRAPAGEEGRQRQRA
jgi:RNA polymerase sigma factor for flagellar operon FliA